MNAVLFQPEGMIRDELHGHLALAACVIMQAVDDVRLFLTTPKFSKGKTVKQAIDARCDEGIRARNAQAAATWLQGPDCADLLELLEACGHHVPMKRFFRELAALKKEVSA
jgi:hypothetical protein